MSEHYLVDRAIRVRLRPMTAVARGGDGRKLVAAQPVVAGVVKIEFAMPVLVGREISLMRRFFRR
jgi:hypothetical protein